MIELSRIFKFEAAHKLPKHSGHCRNMHGHSYKLEIQISGNINLATGMVIDFKDFGDIVEVAIISRLDHTCLNDLVGLDGPPTAEVLAKWIWYRMLELLKNKDFAHLCLNYVKLWETENCSVTIWESL